MVCTYTGAFAPLSRFNFAIFDETCVTRTQPSHVASGHEALIKILGFVLEGSMDLHFCFYPYYFAGVLGFENPAIFMLGP